MRTLKYVIIGLAICSTFSLQAQDKGIFRQIILRAFDQNKSQQELAVAADIIQKRLEIFGLTEMTIDIQGKEPRILIQYNHNVDPSALERIVTATGALEFCETFERQEVEGLIQKPEISKMLYLNKSEPNSAVIGKASEKDAGKVNDYLKKVEKSGKLPADLRFAWSKKVDSEGLLSLYALKYNAEGAPLLTGQNLQHASWLKDDHTQENQISISFDEAGKNAFAEITKAYAGKVIAVAIDQEVYLAPKVMGEITGGKLQITGDFSEAEAASLAAMLGGGVLPFRLEMQ